MAEYIYVKRTLSFTPICSTFANKAVFSLNLNCWITLNLQFK